KSAERPRDAVAEIESLVADLAARLSKPARLVAHWTPSDLPPAYEGAVREALIQLARNSMVHGVESQMRRLQFGKPAVALLPVAPRRHEREGQLEIIFQDDGQGLDLDRIRARARELFGAADLDDGQAAHVVFEPGFSTAASTTGDAGRGVGLDLVRE